MSKKDLLLFFCNPGLTTVESISCNLNVVGYEAENSSLVSPQFISLKPFKTWVRAPQKVQSLQKTWESPPTFR